MNRLEVIRIHFENYGKKRYKAVNDEKSIYYNMKQSGRSAIKSFKSLGEEINRRLGIEKKLIISKAWQNSGTMVDYFWMQFKDEDRTNSASSISLVATKDSFQVWVEWDSNKANNSINSLETHKEYIKYLSEWSKLVDESNYIIGILNLKLNKEVDYSFNEFNENNDIKLKENEWIRVGKRYFYKESDDEFINNIVKDINELDFLYKKTDNNINGKIVNKNNKAQEIIAYKNELKYIKRYIKSKGYSYSSEIIDNFYLSLKTKPFTILSGVSGTGKSKIVKLFAEAVGATVENERFNLISVRPDWSDDSELIGYRDIEGKFKAGIITSIAKRAMENRDKPYFICLDEMNLARVEYYFSSILSLIETRELVDGEIRSNKLLFRENFGDDEEAFKTYGDVYIPENIYIVGTVNMDETTFPFSKKVLDRASTIEFNEINLDYDFDDIFNMENVDGRVYDNSFLKSNYINLAQCIEHRDIAKKVIDKLKEINEILMGENYHFAYRVRDEIVFYVINAVNYDLMTIDRAMDYSITQKILPKIGGSNREIPEILINLFNKFNHKNYNYDELAYGGYHIDELYKFIESEQCIYKVSSRKIVYMIKRYMVDGFTSFWQ